MESTQDSFLLGGESGVTLETPSRDSACMLREGCSVVCILRL